MNIDRFNARSMAAPTVPLSHGSMVGGWLYISGMVARDSRGAILEDDPAEATLQCLDNLEAVLATVGAGRSSVVKVNVYLERLGDYPEMNSVFQEFFSDCGYPARTTVGSQLGLGIVELDCVAYVGTQGSEQ